MSTEPYQPAIPAKVRTGIYAAGLAVGTVSVLVTGGAAVWFPEHAADVLASVGAVSSAAAFLAGATGVAYRPASTGTGAHRADAT